MMMVASIGARRRGPAGRGGRAGRLLPADRPADLRGRPRSGPISRIGGGGRRSRRGLGAVSVGLVLAGGIIMGRGALTTALYAALAVAVFGLLLLHQDQSGLSDRRVGTGRHRRLLDLTVGSDGARPSLSCRQRWVVGDALTRRRCDGAGPAGHPDRHDLAVGARQPLFQLPRSHDLADPHDAVAFGHVIRVAAFIAHSCRSSRNARRRRAGRRDRCPGSGRSGSPCSDQRAWPWPSGRPPWQEPFHTTLSSGAGCQSHIRQPVWVSSSQFPVSQGVVQLISIVSGSPGGQSAFADADARSCAPAGPPTISRDANRKENRRIVPPGDPWTAQSQRPLPQGGCCITRANLGGDMSPTWRFGGHRSAVPAHRC